MTLFTRLPALRALGLAAQAEGFPAAAAVLQRAGFAAQPEAASKPFYAVPEGHQHSDLSDPACNIALSRRKDVTLREDVRLTVKGEQKTLGELLKVRLGEQWAAAAAAALDSGSTSAANSQRLRSPAAVAGLQLLLKLEEVELWDPRLHLLSWRRRPNGAAGAVPSSFAAHRARRRLCLACPIVARCAARRTYPATWQRGTICGGWA